MMYMNKFSIVYYCVLKIRNNIIFFKIILLFNVFNFDIFKFSFVCKCEKYFRILVLLLL